jgi:REP element-mobilizing transposase RayT
MPMKHEFEFTDPRKTPFVEMRTRGELPHLYKENGSYFVTFRLFDAIDPSWSSLKNKDIHRLAATEIASLTEPPLKLGSCSLSRPEIAEIVQNALRHFHDRRYFLSAWCVMPNHVHAVFTPFAGFNPEKILHSWKSYTAHEANRIMGIQGAFWERESFDHLIRNLESFEGFISYIENNPVAAGFCQTPQDWPYSSCSNKT